MKLNRTSIASLSAVMFLALPLAAQPPGRGPGYGPGGGDPSRMLQHLGTTLDLTESQKMAATAIFDAAKKQAEPLQTALSESRQAIESAVNANKSDAEIDALTAKQGTLIGQAGAIQAKAQRSFLGLLTAQQREKLDKLHAERPVSPFDRPRP